MCCPFSSFFYFLFWPGLRRASDGGQAVGYFAADARLDPIDALFVRDFFLVGLVEVCVLVFSTSVCTWSDGADLLFCGAVRFWEKSACFISVFCFVSESLLVWTDFHHCTPGRSSYTPSIRAVTFIKHPLLRMPRESFLAILCGRGSIYDSFSLGHANC